MSGQIPPTSPNPPPSAAPGQTPRAPTPPPPPWWLHPPKQRSLLGRAFRWLGVAVFLLSILLNIYLLMLIGAHMGARYDKGVLRPGADDQVIAVYRIAGLIDSSQGAHFQAFCRDVEKDAKVKAVVLRVDSPGGTVGASDQMHDLVAGLKKKGKKVVVSMGDVAASGGYYVSASADEIVAEPTTLTGSIGVLGTWVVFKGTLEKIGAEAMVVRSTHSRGWKDAISPLRKPDDRQRAYLQTILDQMQARFERVVREGRKDKLSKAALASEMRKIPGQVTVDQAGKQETLQEEPVDPFNGNVYLGEEAKELGLVDEIGGQDKAIDRAKSLADLSNPKVVEYARRRGLFERFLGMRAPSTGIQVDKNLLDELQTPRILMLWRAD